MHETDSLALPAGLFGERKRDVARTCRSAATRIVRGAPIEEAVEGERVHLNDLASYILVDDTLDDGCEHFLGFMLLSAVSDKIQAELDDPIWDRVLDDFGQQPWGLACCLGQDSHHLVYGQQRARTYLRLVARNWAVLNSVGARYVAGLTPGLLYKNAYVIRVGEASSGLLEQVDAAEVAAYEPKGLELPPILRHSIRLSRLEAGAE